jgi:hypothetical protein
MVYTNEAITNDSSRAIAMTCFAIVQGPANTEDLDVKMTSVIPTNVDTIDQLFEIVSCTMKATSLWVQCLLQTNLCIKWGLPNYEALIAIFTRWSSERDKRCTLSLQSSCLDRVTSDPALLH